MGSDASKTRKLCVIGIPVTINQVCYQRKCKKWSLPYAKTTGETDFDCRKQMVNSTGSPQHTPLTTEPRLPELSQGRNLTVGVTAFPAPDTFRFLRLQGHTNTSTVPQDWFHVTCTQTAVLSRYACVISLGKMIMQDEGRYGVVIGNELGEFQYFFRVFFIDGRQRTLV